MKKQIQTLIDRITIYNLIIIQLQEEIVLIDKESAYELIPASRSINCCKYRLAKIADEISTEDK